MFKGFVTIGKNCVSRLLTSHAAFSIFIDAHRPHWPKHISIALLVSIGTLPYALSPWIIKFFYDDAIAQGSWSHLILALSCFCLIQGFAIIIPSCDMMFFGILGLRAMQKLQTQCFSLFLKMSPEAKRRFAPGDLTKRIVDDTSVVSQYGGQKIVAPLVGIIQLGATLPTAFFLSSQLTLILIPILAFQVLLQRIFQRQAATLDSMQFCATSGLNTMLYEHAGNSGVAISEPLYKHCLHEFAKRVQKLVMLSAMSAARMMVSENVNRALTAMMTLSVWALGGYRCIMHQMTIGDLIAFQAVMPMLSGNVIKMTSPLLSIRSGRPSAERISELIDSAYDTKIKKVEKATFDQTLELIDVSFSYSPVRSVLQKFCLKIQSGECIRIVGRNGCGKTTLLNIAVGALMPDRGRILVDKVDLSVISPQSRAKIFAYAPQDVCFFSETLRYNMELFCDIASPRFKEAFDILRLEELLACLPNEWDTRIGDRGIGLSGGQRQLLSLARAIASLSPILVIDEPSTYLDKNVKNLLAAYLEEINRQGRTIVFASHDMGFLPMASTIQIDKPSEMVDIQTK